MRREEEKYIKLALQLATKSKGRTSPNPCVGAVVVKNGKIVGKGYHKKAGWPHAEMYALKEAGKKARGATLYVTLEPCRHYGRTPPCVNFIISAGIKRVVTAMKDPNPINNGRGLSILRRNGVKTEVGILEAEARKLNESFIKYITKQMPFVSVKIAQSLDGKIATRTGDSKWITGIKARAFTHRLRKEADAIIVGARTVLKDDPLLTARIKDGNTKQLSTAGLKRQPSTAGSKRQPLRIILSGKSKIPVSARVLNSEGGQAIIAKARKKDGRVDIKFLLKELAKKGITNVLIEGGGETIASAFEAKVVDKVCFFISPKIIGGRQAVTSVEGIGVDKVSKAIEIKDAAVHRLGGDFMIEGYIRN